MDKLIYFWVSSLYPSVLLLELLPSFFDLLHYLLLPLLHNLMDLFIHLRLIVLDVELSDYIDIWTVLHDGSQVLYSTG